MGKNYFIMIFSHAISELLSPINARNSLGQMPPILGIDNFTELG